MDWLAHEPVLRLTAFAGVFALMAGWEAWRPARARLRSRRLRWSNNLGLVALNTLILRVAFPTAAVGFALVAQERGWGLFNRLDWSGGFELVLAVILLDLAIYAQHVAFHATPWLWRLHRMHHSDVDLDVTSGARFHPLEILLSMVIKLVVVAVLGPDPVAVLLFEIVLNASAMFNHANISLPVRIEPLVRALFVTPDMHRTHHSVRPEETHSNFGFNLSIWDRVFRTYCAEPQEGRARLVLGLPTFRSAKEAWVWPLITQPFRQGE
ncbi:MAG: sterol desaturase family protein [Maricaulaceae bacterium]